MGISHLLSSGHLMKAAVLLGSYLVFSPVSGELNGDPVLGLWRLNEAECQFSSTVPPVSVVRSYEAGDGGLTRISETRVIPDGGPIQVEYVASYDGKEYPRTETGAGAVSGQTVTLKRIDTHTVERIAYLGGKKLTTERWVISQDGKTRTVTQTGTNPQGQQVNIVMVYEKQ